MAELKTQPTKQRATDFLKTIEPEEKRKDALALLKVFKDATGEKPVMWGSAIVGFGKYHYKSERSTQQGDWPLTGFSPRKQNLTVYVMSGAQNFKDLLSKLGKHKVSGGSCVYIKRLADIDIAVLKKLIQVSVKQMKTKYGLK